MARSTKIIATIGPATSSATKLAALIQEGVNLARFNFSHGTTSEFSDWLKRIKAIGRQTGRKIEIIQDLQGPRIRIGGCPKQGRRLVANQRLKLALSSKAGRGQLLIFSPHIIPKISVGDKILIDNGLIELLVEKILSGEVLTKVLVGGLVFNHKGVNFPNSPLKTTFTDKDEQDLKWGVQNKVDYFALSFVEGPDDIENLRKKVPTSSRVLAKIEREGALKKIDSILRVADGIMIARGDLGVEVSLSKLPLIQKRLVQKAKARGKFAIVATQMLANMTVSPLPSRAEVSDIANAVLDGANALMLSEETAVGKYPVEAVKVMREVIESSEEFKQKAESLDEILRD